MPRRLSFWLVLAGLVIVLDQVSKAWITTALALGERVTVTSFFNIVYVFNPGASFNFLADAGGWQRGLFVGLALAISLWLLKMLAHHAREKLLPAALALILGGALGNVIDRIRFGAVVDFLDFHTVGCHSAWCQFPAFNVADSAITAGVALMLWHQFMSKERADA
jgi:signal peptidase II